MLALGKIFQDLLSGGIDKISTLGANIVSVVSTFGDGLVNTIKVLISG